MIITIEGQVLKFNQTEKFSYLDINTKLGVGYRALIPSRYKFKKDEEVLLYTSFQVREDSQILYGFKEERERDFFEKLISVQSIGPKIALSILSFFSPEQVSTYIASGNFNDLSKAPGLGKKGAQKIVLELENSIDEFGFDAFDEKHADKEKISELKEVLKSLGFFGKALDEYVKKGESCIKDTTSIDELVKIVLRES